MADNLTVSIGADTSKLRADLSIATQEVRKLKAEMDKASKEFLTTGDRTRVDQLARQLDGATKSAAALNRELAATNKAVASPAWVAGARGVKALSDEFVTLARTAVPFAGLAGGLLEFVNVIGKAKDELLSLNRESIATGFSATAIKAVREANEDAGGAAEGTSRMMMGLARAMAQVRQDARNSGKEIGSQVQVLRGAADAADETRQRVQELMSGVNVARGGVINKLEVKDAATAFAVLRVNMEKFKDTTEGNDAALEAVIAGFERLEKTGRTDLGNLVAQALNLGRNLKEAIPALRELGGEGLRKAMKTLEEQGRDPNKQRIQDAKDYQKALKDVGDAYEALGFAFLKAFGPTIQTQFRALAEDVTNLKNILDDMRNIVNGTWNWPTPPDWLMRFLGAKPMESTDLVGPEGSGLGVAPGLPSEDRLGIQKSFNYLIENVPRWMGEFNSEFLKALTTTQKNSDNVFLQISKSISETMGKSSIWDKFVAGAKSALDAVKGFFSSIYDAAKQAVSAASNLPTVIRGGQSSSSSGPPPPEMQGGVQVLRGYAPGGLIRGPGTGTSDSILARLSTGEFVINAASTARFLPLLRAINDGMRAPLVPRTSFAAGGLVMATDAHGTPVHLHFDGHEFPLRTDATVAESLMRTARAKQMLSAGRKPGWAGGRRYGG